MQLIKQAHYIIGETPYNFDDFILWIEKAGRTCYKSWDNIVEGSGRTFVKNIIERGHLSVLEHSNLVLRSHKVRNPIQAELDAKKKYNSPFIRTAIKNDCVYVFGSYRAFFELLQKSDRTWVNFCKIPTIFSNEDYVCLLTSEDVPDECKSYTVKFITNRAMSHELVRHRICAISQESQRYCKYTKDLNVIIPIKYYDTLKEGYYDRTCLQANDITATENEKIFLESAILAEVTYKKLLETESPQSARNVLPNSVATEIVMTCPIFEWEWIFGLRTGRGADPQMIALITPLRDEFISRKYVVS